MKERPFQQYYTKALSEFEEAKTTIQKNTDEGLAFYLLQKTVENLLNSLISFYEIPEPEEKYIDFLIEHIENQTTIKFPETLREELFELSFIPYEGGCASSTVYEKRPESFINTVEKLKEFVEEEIPVIS